jgi:hypothetical protein
LLPKKEVESIPYSLGMGLALEGLSHDRGNGEKGKFG